MRDLRNLLHPPLDLLRATNLTLKLLIVLQINWLLIQRLQYTHAQLRVFTKLSFLDSLILELAQAFPLMLVSISDLTMLLRFNISELS